MAMVPAGPGGLANRAIGAVRRHPVTGAILAGAGYVSQMDPATRRMILDKGGEYAGKAWEQAKSWYRSGGNNSPGVVLLKPRRKTRIPQGVEDKFFDMRLEFSNPVYESEVRPQLVRMVHGQGTLSSHMSPISIGSGGSDRTGRNIWMKNINIRVAWTTNAAVYDNLSYGIPEVSLFLVLDRNAGQLTTPDPSAIWVNPSNTEQMGGRCLRNLEYKDRYSVLATRHMTFGDVSTVAAVEGGAEADVIYPNTTRYIEIFKDMRNKKQQFFGDDGTAPSNWALYLFQFTYAPNDMGVAGNMNLAGNVRVRYSG